MAHRSRLLFWVGPLPGLVPVVWGCITYVVRVDDWNSDYGQLVGFFLFIGALLALPSLVPLIGLKGWQSAGRWGVIWRVLLFVPSWVWGSYSLWQTAFTKW